MDVDDDIKTEPSNETVKTEQDEIKTEKEVPVKKKAAVKPKKEPKPKVKKEPKAKVAPKKAASKKSKKSDPWETDSDGENDEDDAIEMWDDSNTKWGFPKQKFTKILALPKKPSPKVNHVKLPKNFSTH